MQKNYYFYAQLFYFLEEKVQKELKKKLKKEKKN